MPLATFRNRVSLPALIGEFRQAGRSEVSFQLQDLRFEAVVRSMTYMPVRFEQGNAGRLDYGIRFRRNPDLSVGPSFILDDKA